MRRIFLLPLLLGLLFALALPVAAQGPELTVVSPTQGEEINSTTVTVAFETANINLVQTTVPVSEAGQHPEANRPGEGHLHLMLDLQPLVVWERGDPYTFSNVPPGEHQLMVEIVNNDHSPLSPRVVQTIQFETGGAPAVMPVTGASADPVGVAGGLLIASIGLLAGAAGLALRRKRGEQVRTR